MFWGTGNVLLPACSLDREATLMEREGLQSPQVGISLFFMQTLPC